MTAFVWLLLAACGSPFSAYRPDSSLQDPLQAEATTSAIQGALEDARVTHALGHHDVSDKCTPKTEEEAINFLARLWDTKVDSKKLNKCLVESKEPQGSRRTHFAPLATGFSVTCKAGRIVILAIKKAQIGLKVSDLNSGICALPHLQQLFLDESKISGSLKEVAKYGTNLSRLSLRWCKLEGDLHDLRDFKRLKALKLSGPSIHGSLKDLKQKLEFLDLRSTSVTGNVSQMQAEVRSSLKGLWLQNTSVTGDVMEILNSSENLMYLHLSRTQVSGTVGNPGSNEGQKLKELVLSNSKVKFQMKAIPKKAPFPDLSTLDVTGCNLSMDVWEFLFPFAELTYTLSQVRAANCSLSGDLQGIYATSHKPMRWQLTLLDLSYNNITSLSGTARACWLDASNNPHLTTIDYPSYFEEPTLLDLRNTSYNASGKEKIWKILEPEDVAKKTLRCKGVKVQKASENGISRGRVLVTPSSFAAEKLCNCTVWDLEALPQGCCGCKDGTMSLTGNLSQKVCWSCFGPGCDSKACFEASKQCAEGYAGPLCASCQEQNYRSNGFARCKKCTQVEHEVRIPMIASVMLLIFFFVTGSLWFWVWRDPTTNSSTEQGQRVQELLEQLLLLLTYAQIFREILSSQHRASSNPNKVEVNDDDGPLQLCLKGLISLDVASVFDLFSVQCMLGFEHGRNLEVVVAASFLPALVIIALMLALCRWQSPFYGLKYAIVVASLGYQMTVQQIWTNLFWCETKSARGWDLGSDAFLTSRPFIQCQEAIHTDPIRYVLLAALFVNGAVIPGGLCILGIYITRRIRHLQSLSASIIPVIQCDSNEELVTLQFATIQVAAEKLPLSKEDLQKHRSFPSRVVWIFASAYVACIGKSIESESVEVVEAHFSPKICEHDSQRKEKSIDILKLKLRKSGKFKELSEKSKARALRDAQAEAQRLSKMLLYRAIAKHMTQGQGKGALWIGARCSFERFADKDPLACEGFWKLFLLAVTKMCLGAQGAIQTAWIAAAMGATSFGIHITRPFGSQSRNNLATVCFGALSCSALAAAPLCRIVGEINVTIIPPAVFEVCVLLPAAFVFLFFLHLQVMPGDVLLQANRLQADLKRSLGVNEEGHLDKMGKNDDEKDQDEIHEEKESEDFEKSEAAKKPPESTESCVLPLKPSVLQLQTPEYQAFNAKNAKFIEQYRGLARAWLHHRRRSSL